MEQFKRTAILWGSCLLLVTFFEISFANDIPTTMIPSEFTTATTTTTETTTREEYVFGVMVTAPYSQCPVRDWSLLDLPKQHLRVMMDTYPFYIQRYCNGCEKCARNFERNYKIRYLPDVERKCWGYETSRPCKEPLLKKTECSSYMKTADSRGNMIETFYNQTDFGYIRNQRNLFTEYCEPHHLDCTDYMQFCRGHNVLIDYRQLPFRTTKIQYDIDVLKPSDIGSDCSKGWHWNKSATHLEHLSPLESWAPEMRNFWNYGRLYLESGCVERPTIIMKLDSTVNMYHHFCDFLNLYVSLHINNTDESAFSTDVNILLWESGPYRSPFNITFNAFTRHPIQTLDEVSGQVICYRRVMFPTLSRMVNGLYYNTPLEEGCSKSGLFDAFREHILHRLRIPVLAKPEPFRLRITYLIRKTPYRVIENSPALLDAMDAEHDKFLVNSYIFEDMDFEEQLTVIRNTDIFIGMHGAGLTHLLFLPIWATVFEVYNCGDPKCYKNLARMRGVNYITLEDPRSITRKWPKEKQFDKFNNYTVNPSEFMRLVWKAARSVNAQPEFQNYKKSTTKTRAYHEPVFGEMIYQAD